MEIARSVLIHPASKETKSEDEIIGALQVNLEKLRPALNTDDYAYLMQVSSNGNVVMRGAERGKNGSTLTKWNTVQIGDIALITWEWYVRAIGEVTFLKQSRELARLGNSGDSKFELLTFCETSKSCTCPMRN